jgi:putative transposase
VNPLKIVKKNRKDFLRCDVNEPEMDLLRKHERTGRPLGKEFFIETMESFLNRRLKPQKTRI